MRGGFDGAGGDRRHGRICDHKRTRRQSRNWIAMQLRALAFQPRPLGLVARTQARNLIPEGSGMVHLDQMGDLVGGDVIKHLGRRHDQPPAIRQRPGMAARAPARAGIAQRDSRDRGVQAGRRNARSPGATATARHV